jgi:integrase
MMLRFLIFTACRTNQVVEARWSEIDRPSSTWKIPGERMKMNQDHVVPLTEPALAILDKMREGTHGELIFPNTRRRSVFRECDARRTGSPRLQSRYGARIPFDIRTILMACARLRWRISTSRRPRQLTSAGKSSRSDAPS